MSILNRISSWLLERQWTEWEIITIALVVLFVPVWIIIRQRKRMLRNIYDNKFLESTPVIGAKLGVRKKRRDLIRDFKKSQLAATQRANVNQHHDEHKNDPQKLHEEIQQLQREIIKYKKNEVHLEEKIGYLTSTNEQHQLEIKELKKNLQDDERVTPEPVTVESEQAVVPESEPAEQDSGSQDVEKSAEEKQAERTSTTRGRAYEQLHRVVDDVRQKFCRKCNEWKPESKFHKNATSKDGLAGSCKKCKAETAKEYRRRRKAAQE